MTPPIPTTIKRLEIFIQYMEQRNMRLVSNILKMNSISVYRAIHQLESDLGCVLFEKKGRTLSPLKSAEVLYQQGLASLNQLSQTIDNTKIAAGINPERLRIGTVDSMTVDLVPHLLQHFHERCPNIELKFYSGHNTKLIEDLKKSDLDLVILYGSSELESVPSFSAVKLFDDTLMFAVSSASKQPNGKNIPIKINYLKQQKFMVLTKNFGLRQSFDFIKEISKQHLDIHSEFSSIFSIAFALQSSDYASLLPSRFKPIADRLAINLYPLAKEINHRHSIYLLTNKANETHFSIRALISECKMYKKKSNLLLSQ